MPVLPIRVEVRDPDVGEDAVYPGKEDLLDGSEDSVLGQSRRRRVVLNAIVQNQAPDKIVEGTRLPLQNITGLCVCNKVAR